ncbi:hypothetical protein [Clostridium sp. BJN0013]|uniref:hypothetical protein n=1 Tax=Clostridium sp. BJN0013 TaxID=3236840 RepID=UPI0034C670AF
MNRKLGLYSSIITLAAVLGFALSMMIGSDFGSYISSMFIAWGFVPMICSFASYSEKKTKALSYSAIAFASVYAVLIMVVYFAQLTAVRLSQLSQQASQILDYKNFGLFFSYDLLGYVFMALATFFIAFTIRVTTKMDKWLKALLMIHGIFAVSCVIIPILGLFNADMTGGDLLGVMVLEIWCAYFTPVCVLSYLYFKKAYRLS